ncbi:unnamed protein product [Citrullus colocynthis]|uniref:Uncharacterized protein n=1 Tax=Citrullus colocynthis TaxID=252529 RepID=A0ABP0YT97_9ROSI
MTRLRVAGRKKWKRAARVSDSSVGAIGGKARVASSMISYNKHELEGGAYGLSRLLIIVLFLLAGSSRTIRALGDGRFVLRSNGLNILSEGYLARAIKEGSEASNVRIKMRRRRRNTITGLVDVDDQWKTSRIEMWEESAAKIKQVMECVSITITTE